MTGNELEVFFQASIAGWQIQAASSPPPGYVEQDRIGVVVHGQFDAAVAHGGHVCAGNK